MRLPSFKRLFSTDFKKDFKDLIDQLSLSLNTGIDVLYTALNNNLTLRDNFKATIKDIFVIVDSNGTPTSGAGFQLRDNSRIDGIVVILVINTNNTASYPTSGVFISGQQTGNTYNINNITGLVAGPTYQLRIVAFAQ